MTRRLCFGLLVATLVVLSTILPARAEEATETKLVPIIVESINGQYGDAQFGWQRIRADKYQFEYGNPSGDIRMGIRHSFGNVGAIGTQNRLLVRLSGTDLTEVRPEMIFFDGDWYTFFSAGISTSNGAVSLYNETVWDWVKEDDWRLGVGFVHTGGLSHQASTNYLGPHLNVNLSDKLNLDLHWGAPISSGGDNEAWAILKWTVQ